MSENRLSSETSPYLKQHQDNPVWWQPWGDAAFEQAASQQKPVFLSIGYSTCYWCHVMEKDSFESPEVASVLNERFICIKVDREERPDVDQIYMDALVGLTGHGGWPMSVFLTPNRKPFWAGTYFPRAQFLKILVGLSDAWRNEPGKVVSSAQHIVEVLKSREGGERNTQTAKSGDSILDAVLPKGLAPLLGAFAERFDPQAGGFGDAPKFPPSTQVSLLLSLSRALKDSALGRQARHMALFTLEKMACGGIFDQIGGGFHRYSTDAEWLVPHFEKMLYDNALLAYTYLDAFQVSGNDFFGQVARKTLGYIARDLQDAEGCFYAAEDAGDVGKEGEFYVWKEEELKSLFNAEEYERFATHYRISSAGNFEHGNNILTVTDASAWMKTSEPEYIVLVGKLLEQRDQRVRPHCDRKVLAGWNGLAIRAFARGFQLLREDSLLSTATVAADVLLQRLFSGDALLRSYCEGQARHRACLDDYAYLIQGLRELYRASLDHKWLSLAVELQHLQDKCLWDSVREAYQYSEAPDLFMKKFELVDGATPSANAVSVENLQELSVLTQNLEFGERANRLLKTIAEVASQYSVACASFWLAGMRHVRGAVEIKFPGAPNGPGQGDFSEWAQRELDRDVYLRSEAEIGELGSESSGIILCAAGLCEPAREDSQSFRSDIAKRVSAPFI